MPLRGLGVGPLMANAILNFHFDFLTPSLTQGIRTLRGEGVDGEEPQISSAAGEPFKF